MIPRTIHQTWRSRDVPPRWRAYQATWSAVHPDWTYTLWTDHDCRALVAQFRPDLLGLYDSYPLPIQRADAFRYVLLASEGGLYVDLDFECLRPLPELFDGAAVVIGVEPASHADDAAIRSRGLSRIVCNAFMASEAGHPFWNHVLDLMSQHPPDGSVLDTTGVFLLSQAVDSYPRQDELRIVESALLYPITKWEVWNDLDPSVDVDRAFAVHHWSSSWQRDRLQRAALELARQRARRAGR